MKKIFTLILGAAMLAPMASADEVTLSICPYDGAMASGYDIYSPVATGKGTINYDATTGLYTMTNFMGYSNVTLEFLVDPEYTQTVGNEEFVYVGFSKPADNSLYYVDGSWKLRMNWSKVPGYVEGISDTEMSLYGSGIFTGDDDEFRFRINGINGCIEDVTAATALNNIMKRSRAVKNGNGYKFYFQLDCPNQWAGSGDSFTYEDSMTLNGVTYGGYQYYLTFSYPDNQSSIAEIEAEDANAPVEYYNLQGIRIENPTNGLYICRQGNNVSKVIL